MRRQQSMKPESVPAGLETARHVRDAAQLGRGCQPELSDEFRRLAPERNRSDGKKAPALVRIASLASLGAAASPPETPGVCFEWSCLPHRIDGRAPRGIAAAPAWEVLLKGSEPLKAGSGPIPNFVSR
jgi:hypothetical protein